MQNITCFLSIFFALVTLFSHQTSSQTYPAQVVKKKSAFKLSKPLFGDDGRVYACAENNLFAFESNGSIAWSVHLNYRCNTGAAPVYGGIGKILVVAQDRILKVNFRENGTTSGGELLFGPGPGEESLGEILGFCVSTMTSSLFINVKHRGLYAYTMEREQLWIAGPKLDQFGYRLGCRKDANDCFFTSAPVIDRCEANIYISNTEGELYSLSLRSPHFRWIQDFSSLDKVFTITSGNNGKVYVTVPLKSRLLALDASSGNILWQANVGPLSAADSAPVVNTDGWVSIGSLDGYLYSFSPTGALRRYPKKATLDSAIIINPYVHCSGDALYISQTKMDGKISRVINGSTYVSALKPESVVFTLLAPSTGSVYWSGRYPDQFSSLLSHKDLQHFLLDERIVLAFVTASNIDSPFQCRSRRQKLVSSCSLARPTRLSIYIGNERAIMKFLMFESILLLFLAVLVRFCCTFWAKKKIQNQQLGKFFEKRRSLQLKKKAFNRTITELQQRAADEAVAAEVVEELGDLVRERDGVERKLSTTYSLGRDSVRSLLPLQDCKNVSFQKSRNESVSVVSALSDTSSRQTSSNEDDDVDDGHDDGHEETMRSMLESKEKSMIQIDDESFIRKSLWKAHG